MITTKYKRISWKTVKYEKKILIMIYLKMKFLIMLENSK